MSEEKIFIKPADLLYDSFRLGAKILESGFLPDYIVAIWRGGTPIGIAVQELLDYAGVETDHIAIRTSYYTGIEKTSDKVQVHGLGYLIDKICHEDCLLIVDDVFDTGQTIDAVLKQLQEKARRNTPGDIRVAVPYYKPARNRSSSVGHTSAEKCSKWCFSRKKLVWFVVSISIARSRSVSSRSISFR